MRTASTLMRLPLVRYWVVVCHQLLCLARLTMHLLRIPIEHLPICTEGAASRRGRLSPSFGKMPIFHAGDSIGRTDVATALMSHAMLPLFQVMRVQLH